MKASLLFLLLVPGVFAQDDYGCEDDCTCPDLNGPISGAPDAVQFTQLAGCVANVTCEVNLDSYITIFFDDAGIPAPADSENGRATAPMSYPSSISTGPPAGSYIDLYSYFGMICENDEWYITKYPNGLTYINTDFQRVVYPETDLDGKKSKMIFYFCN